MRFLRVVLEGLLVAFLAGLVFVVFKKHLILALMLGALVCLVGIGVIALLERRRSTRRSGSGSEATERRTPLHPRGERVERSETTWSSEQRIPLGQVVEHNEAMPVTPGKSPLTPSGSPQAVSPALLGGGTLYAPEVSQGDRPGWRAYCADAGDTDPEHRHGAELHLTSGRETARHIRCLVTHDDESFSGRPQGGQVGIAALHFPGDFDDGPKLGEGEHVFEWFGYVDGKELFLAGSSFKVNAKLQVFCRAGEPDPKQAATQPTPSPEPSPRIKKLKEELREIKQTVKEEGFGSYLPTREGPSPSDASPPIASGGIDPPSVRNELHRGTGPLFPRSGDIAQRRGARVMPEPDPEAWIPSQLPSPTEARAMHRQRGAQVELAVRQLDQLSGFTLPGFVICEVRDPNGQPTRSVYHLSVVRALRVSPFGSWNPENVSFVYPFETIDLPLLSGPYQVDWSASATGSGSPLTPLAPDEFAILDGKVIQ